MTHAFTNKCIVALAALLLVLPHAANISGLTGGVDAIQETEKRLPAPFPQWDTLSEGRAYTESWDAYLTDHLGLKFEVMKTLGVLAYVGGYSLQDNIVGQDGWYYSAGKPLQQHLSMITDAHAQVGTARRFIQDINGALELRGIPRVFVFPPNKHTIYPEYLPAWAQHTSSSLLQNFQGSLNDLPVLDLQQVLLSEKDDDQLYHKRDTHWTHAGAFRAYLAVMEALAEDTSLRDPLTWNDVRRVHANRLGDLARGEYLENIVSEDAVSLRIKGPQRKVISREKLKKYQSWWQRNTVAKANTANDVSVLLLGDSFSIQLAPFFENSFDTTYLIMHHQGRFDPCLIDDFKPDIVVVEIVEKNLAGQFEELDWSACSN